MASITTRARTAALVAVATCSPAVAEVQAPEPPTVSPFDRARVTAEWTEPTARFAGARWAGVTEFPGVPSIEIDLTGLTSVDAPAVPPAPSTPGHPLLGQSAGPDAATLALLGGGWDAAHAAAVEASPAAHLLHAPALHGPSDDRRFAHAMLVVRFTQLPAPGAPAAGLACLGIGARRRR